MARVKDDFRNLTGPQKAAIFMLSLSEEQSAKMFEMMDDEEIRELSQIMSSLGSINSKVVERLFIEFADQISSAGS
ncbi:MAG: flagellar motor switch protein FliG, partial [Rhodospirillaceae bacterium]|nr:flagellar motor switch protein FliG [Rhodospirillaceae bacterium]